MTQLLRHACVLVTGNSISFNARNDLNQFDFRITNAYSLGAELPRAMSHSFRRTLDGLPVSSSICCIAVKSIVYARPREDTLTSRSPACSAIYQQPPHKQPTSMHSCVSVPCIINTPNKNIFLVSNRQLQRTEDSSAQILYTGRWQGVLNKYAGNENKSNVQVTTTTWANLKRA